MKDGQRNEEASPVALCVDVGKRQMSTALRGGELNVSRQARHCDATKQAFKINIWRLNERQVHSEQQYHAHD